MDKYMMEQDIDQPTQPQPDEQTGLEISSFLKIVDPDSGELLLQQRDE